MLLSNISRTHPRRGWKSSDPRCCSFPVSSAPGAAGSTYLDSLVQASPLQREFPLGDEVVIQQATRGEPQHPDLRRRPRTPPRPWELPGESLDPRLLISTHMKTIPPHSVVTDSSLHPHPSLRPSLKAP